MPRPKGSKNKPKTVKSTVDFAAQITEKQAAKKAATVEIASITEPVVRVMVEAPDHDTCQKYVSQVVEAIKAQGYGV